MFWTELFVGLAFVGVGYLIYRKAKKSNRPVSKGEPPLRDKPKDKHRAG